VWPEHTVTTEEVLADIRRARTGSGADGRAWEASARIVRALGVESRSMVLPLDQVGRGGPIEERNSWVLREVYGLGVRAARSALEGARLAAGEVDVIVAAHASGVAMPGLAVHLAQELGLRPDVRQVPVTQLGCAGGAWSLATAAELVAARPGRRVLVVAAEALSCSYRPARPGTVGALYNGLFGDGAAACVVSSDWRGPGLRITDSWTHLLPGSADAYRMEVDQYGQGFTSTRAALRAAGECMPALVDWLKTAGPEEWPTWAAVHPGGPRVIEAVAEHLPDPPDLAASWQTLRERGNFGGPTVLDVLRRHYAAPPQHGAPGLLLAFGPGFLGAAVRGTWQEHPAEPAPR
jgi:predicted naringenin-chalcone synthase